MSLKALNQLKELNPDLFNEYIEMDKDELLINLCQEVINVCSLKQQFNEVNDFMNTIKDSLINN